MSRTNGLKFALDERYVTKDYCENKKQRYISKELCESKESAIRSDVNEIKEDIRMIKENHLAHMQESLNGMKNDISELKVKIALYSALAVVIVQLVFQYLFK